MKKSYQFYEDPGHGWLRVERSELVRLRISNEISGYSYQRGLSVYLEEDGDLSIFIEAKMRVDDLDGKDFKFKENHTNRQSKIRNYQSYRVL